MSELYSEYLVDFKDGTISRKKVFENDALKIWIYKALKTVRYSSLIYSWDFGSSLFELIGKGYSLDYLQMEVERFVVDVLSVNENIINVYNFNIQLKGDILHICFDVKSVFGILEGVDIVVWR